MLALIGLVFLVATVTMLMLAAGVWSPYWVSSAVVRFLDRRGLPQDPDAPPRIVDRAATRRYAKERFAAWARHVNGRFYD